LKDDKRVYYDKQLKIEVLSFKGNVQGFPIHFHDYYVIGFISYGDRDMICNNKQYHISTGDIIIFNPNDTHSCVNDKNESFVYYAINISKETMKNLYTDNNLPVFSANVIKNNDMAEAFNNLYNKIICKSDIFDREESLILFINMLAKDYLSDKANETSDEINQIKTATDYINKNFQKHITLDELCKISAMSKTTLIRHFTKMKGITPYRYLESKRIDYAKSLLEKSESAIDVSISAGFSDQSHFTNSFIKYIGLTPSNYRNIFKESKNEK